MGNGILVIAEHEGGVFKKTAGELIAKAKALGLGPVTALVIGHSGGAERGGFGADAGLAGSGGDVGRDSNTPRVGAVQ
ncbi:MAG: hypothetical protein JNM72_05900, partial [Deltaproteobacteria bacterium]|nr:hypothetical protein [Deltaproteobacteria bacterium]